MTYVLSNEEAQALGFDLALTVARFAADLAAHRFTVDFPAPTSHPVVERIVRDHGGRFQVLPPPPAPEPPAPEIVEPPEPEVPQRISARQIRLQLLAIDKLTDVEAYVATQATETKIAWEYATEFDRLNPLFVQASQALGFTEEQRDQFFISASQL